MARANLTVQDAPAPYTGAGLDLNFQAGDAVNGHQARATGREMLFARNTDSVARSVTLVSTPDPYGRSGNLVKSVPAGGVALVAGPIPMVGWQQVDGNIYVNVDAAALQLAVIRL